MAPKAPSMAPKAPSFMTEKLRNLLGARRVFFDTGFGKAGASGPSPRAFGARTLNPKP